MQVMHNGYGNPDNLKFDNITVLGVPNAPSSVSVTHVTNGNSTTILPNTSLEYDATKKVKTHTACLVSFTKVHT